MILELNFELRKVKNKLIEIAGKSEGLNLNFVDYKQHNIKKTKIKDNPSTEEFPRDSLIG